MTKELNVILDGQMTGRVVRDTRCRIYFTYEENWREAENAYPLSLSMPLALSGHGNDKIDPLLWGFDYVGRDSVEISPRPFVLPRSAG